jgi:hypothetical protein
MSGKIGASLAVYIALRLRADSRLENLDSASKKELESTQE